MGRLWGEWEIIPMVEQGLGYVSFTVTLCLILAPIKTFRTILAKRSTLEYKAAPFLAAFFNFGLWVLYALYEPGKDIILVLNIAGAAIETVYIFIYGLYCTDRWRFFGKFFVAVLGVGAVGAVVQLEVLPDVNGDSFAAFATGLLASCSNVIMYGAPLSALPLVIKSKSVRFMPLGLSAAGFGMSVCWLAYSVYTGDVWIFIPNVLGLFLGITQLSLYARYRSWDHTGVLHDSEYDGLLGGQQASQADMYGESTEAVQLDNR